MNSQSKTKTLSPSLIFLLAIAIGITVANLYYAQPLIAQISAAIGLSKSAAGLVVTLTQAGYGLGVLLLVPLADIIESRGLILAMIGLTIFGLLGLSFSTSMRPYFAAAFATGLGASSVQVMVPYASHFVPDETRGRVVGRLMSGLMLGIMLSRPIASLMTQAFSWHAVFVLSAVLMLLLAIILAWKLPRRHPHNPGLVYTQLLGSMGRLFFEYEILRRRAIYQACLFGSFCLFWSASPLLLSGPEFHFSQSGIALFALVGVSGAISAPLAGLAADRGWTRAATALAMLLSAATFLISRIFLPGSTAALAALVIAAILLDAGITANLVLGQREIFALSAELRARLNGLYIATIFVGGAVGSALGAWSFEHGGWSLTSWTGFLMPMSAFAYFLTEKRKA